MPKIRRILSVIDPTADSQFALQRAAWFAKLCGARLDVLHCYYDELLHGHRLLDLDLLETVKGRELEAHRKRLTEMLEPIRARGIRCDADVVWDHPLDEGIVRYAVSKKVDIVFKDTHKHSGLGFGRLTNTDWSLMRACPMPLWFVKPTDLPEDLHFIAAIDPFSLDDEHASLDKDSLSLGGEIAKASGGVLHAVHTFDARIGSADAYSGAKLSGDDSEETARRSVDDTVCEVVQSAKVLPENTHVLAGSTHTQLPILSDELGAAAVIMGAVSRNRLERIFIGATAEVTLDRLSCDLVVVRPNWSAAAISPSPA